MMSHEFQLRTDEYGTSMRTRSERKNLAELERHQLVVGCFVLLALVAVYVAFYEPVLHVDDWSQIVYRHTRGQLSWFAGTDIRPLLYAPILLVFELVGESMPAFYAILGGLTIIAGVQFYLLTRQILPDMPTTALLAAALFLVYPVDYTRMYLTMISIRVAVCLVLLFAQLLLAYVESDSRYRGLFLFAALTCLTLSLGIYEAQLGVALAWVSLLVVTKTIDRYQRIGLVSPLLLTLLFGLWRTVGRANAGVATRYVQLIELEPIDLLSRILVGLRALIVAWTEPVSRALATEQQGGAMLIIYAMVALSILVGRRLVRKESIQEDGDEAKATAIRRTILLLAGGGLFTIAGYIPIVIVYIPSLNGRFSRTNLFASFGAAIVLVALLRLITISLTPNRRQAARLLTLISLPFLVLGIITQAWVQYDANVAWEEQRQIWRGLLQIAPDLKENTDVYFVMLGYEDKYSLIDWRRAPLNANWEVNAALRVLYDDATLEGDVIHPDLPLPQAELAEEGIISPYSRELTAYEDAVVVQFNRESRSVQLIEDLSGDLALGWEVSRYAPAQRIRSASTLPETTWHRLILSPEQS